MITYSKSYGVLKNKRQTKEGILYTLDKDGKKTTYLFKNDECPHSNIGDELYVIYTKNLSSLKKGILISNDINLMIVKDAPFNLMLFNFIALSGIIVSEILLLDKLLYMNSLSSLFITFFIVSFISFITAYIFGNNETLFNKIKLKKNMVYNKYKRDNFTKKEILFNKKLTSLEKDRLRNFIQCQKEIKGSEKLEIIDIIEHSKKIKVSDIDFLDIKALRKKHKYIETIKLLISK